MATYTRKAYRDVAAIIARAYDAPVTTDYCVQAEFCDYLTVQFAELFAADTPRFDRERFIEACSAKPQDPTR